MIIQEVQCLWKIACDEIFIFTMYSYAISFILKYFQCWVRIDENYRAVAFDSNVCWIFRRILHSIIVLFSLFATRNPWVNLAWSNEISSFFFKFGFSHLQIMIFLILMWFNLSFSIIISFANIIYCFLYICFMSDW